MEIALPKEPVYYYECSAGRFRLVYFIPHEKLHQLRRENRISAQALKDLPDGVDLGCTEPDFAEFNQLYGYRPPIDPESLQQAFYAILTTTQDWQKFRGSGFIPAADLEKQVLPVNRELESLGLPSAKDEPPQERPTLSQRRAFMAHRARKHSRMEESLQKLPAKDIDPEKTLRHQKFSKISIREGKPVEEVFADLLQGRGR